MELHDLTERQIAALGQGGVDGSGGRVGQGAVVELLAGGGLEQAKALEGAEAGLDAGCSLIARGLGGRGGRGYRQGGAEGEGDDAGAKLSQVSQSLFSTTLHVRTAQRALEAEQVDAAGPVGEELGEIGQLTRGALAEMRALIFELRPDALAEEGLVAALTQQASALGAREGLVVQVDGPDERLPLGPKVEEQLYRLSQEALANVVKHARASSAMVRIAANDDTVTVEVHDDGRGFDPAAVGPEHFGLRSMQGRVADLGGCLEITSAPGHGTVLRVEVPAQH